MKSFPKTRTNKYTLYLIVTLVTITFHSIAFSQNTTDRIQLNQLGFYPYSPKVAVVTGATTQTDFTIASPDLKTTFYNGKMSDEKKSANSSTVTKIADFSAFTKNGNFVLLINGVGQSYVFNINDNVNKPAAISTLKGYYYQRVSMPLPEKFAGKWHRDAGHPDTAVFIHPSAATERRPAGTNISTLGGWYDAGDYNKYIVNSGITMGTLLSAYEDFPQYFKILNTNIPESGNGVPDILNEIIYNLRWMLTMQDPNDGGVYNKCTNASFDGMVMPGVTKAARYVVQKGTAATLDLAAVAAQAARILQPYKSQLPGLADSCMSASKKAWDWAIVNPALEYNQNMMNQIYKPVISTGGYGDRNFNDEWFWAASELFLSTQENKYADTVGQHINYNVNLPGWGNVAMLGYYSFLRSQKNLPATFSGKIMVMKDRIISMANNYVGAMHSNAFQTVIGQSPREFGWGSNSTAANQGVLLVNAYQLTHDKKYLDGALSNLDYLLGRNATGYCFVTGAGTKSPMFPHHRQSTADGIKDPVPGLLVGGPNPGKQDKCDYAFSEPETTYLDAVCSYASNEIAINWNAPMVYLANAIEALKNEAGYVSKKQ